MVLQHRHQREDNDSVLQDEDSEHSEQEQCEGRRKTRSIGMVKI